MTGEARRHSRPSIGVEDQVGRGDRAGIVGQTIADQAGNADHMSGHNKYIVITDKVGIGDYNVG